ncbi:MAG: helix-turn-helix domain-containing protein [Bacteroidota bacterium]
MRALLATQLSSLFCCLLLLGGGALWGQTTFVVDEVPAQTPMEDSIYVVGSFNNWQPGEEAYRLYPKENGSYILTLGNLSPPFEYKFTRGSWATGESDPLGKPAGNRQQQNGEAPLTIVSKIEGWEDLPSLQAKAYLRIRVNRIPANTPEDASLFVTGDFNSWQPGDPEFELQAQDDGSWQVAVPLYRDTLEYKFLRGSWATVEGRKSGRARFNRQYVYQAEQAQPYVALQIESWEDLSGNVINAYTVFWLIAAIQGFLILIAINTIDRPIPTSNRLLSVLLLLFSFALLARVVVYDREIFQWQPKLLLVPDLLYFLYAPLFVLYIQRLLRSSPLVWDWKRWLIFLPFVLHLLAYLPLLLMDRETFVYKAVDRSLIPYFETVGGIALLYNMAYWWYAFRFIGRYRHESENQFSSGSNITFLSTIMWLKAFCLLLWVAIYVVGAYASIGERDLHSITDRMSDVLWIGFSLTVFLLGYFTIREPEIFRLPVQSEPEDADLISASPVEPREGLDFDPALRERLGDLMQNEQPYLNPGLSLSDLAAQVHSTPHELSRVINQGFGKNFNDFVNTYRVEAFKSKVLEPAYRNHTLLAVAFMVGFNSKTAFNRAFKKISGQTPGEYFRSQGSES